jgi:hypothetical protein
MKKPEDILKQSIEALKKTNIPPGPPPELIDITVAKLTNTSGGSQEKIDKIRSFDKIIFAKSLIKYAAAAVILISTGYFTGRLSAPKMPDVQQLQATLEPAIRQKVLMDITQYLQGSLAGSFTQLKDELQQQYRQDMTDFAIQTLAATNAMTNQQLEKLIESIYTAQTEDRRWVATALNQVESNRLQDTTQLANAVKTLAVHTEDRFQQTEQDILNFLSYNKADSVIPNKIENSNDIK